LKGIDYEKDLFKISGDADRYVYGSDENSDFVQAGNLYRILDESKQDDLVANIVRSLSNATPEIQALQVSDFKKADVGYGSNIEKELSQGK